MINKGINIGTPITMKDGFMDLNEYYCGRALDDKIGGMVNIEVLKYLKEENIKLPFNLVVVNAVQEEVGLKGAEMAAKLIKPDIAIVIDVTHDTSTLAYDKKIQGSVNAGEGLVIMDTPSIHKKLKNTIIEIAELRKLPYQLVVNGKSSGTNADSYAYPNGIPTALLKLAMRYMHTTVEMVSKKDVGNLIELLKSIILSDKLIQSYKYH